MSFLSNLFSRSPDRAVSKARAALERGEWAEALRRIEAVLERPIEDGALRQEAEAVRARARAGLVDLNRRNARECAAAGEWGPALESLDVALENCDDPALRREIESERHRYQIRAGRAASRDERPRAPAAAVAGMPAGLDDDGGPQQDPFGDEVDRFELYLASLAPEAAQLFEAAAENPRFREACLMLEDGDGKGATRAFSELLKERPEDPLLLFQRGRARMLTADLPGAAQDLQAVRSAWGFAALDAAGHLHVGILLAEVYHALGRLDDAEAILAAAVEERGEDPDLWVLLGRTRVLRQDPEGALAAADRVLALAPPAHRRLPADRRGPPPAEG